MTELTCPQCGAGGRKVKPITIASLALTEVLAGLETTEGFAYCPTSNCAVVWFHADTGQILDRAACRVRVGMKETESPRPVCYCFDHSVEEIEDEIQRLGQTDIAATIAAKCRQGLDHCEETNPQGSCCLGNINKVVKAATPHQPASPFGTVEAEDCCNPNTGRCDLDQ